MSDPSIAVGSRANPLGTAAEPGSERLWKRAWMVTGMLFLFMVVNYADRAAFGLAAEPLMRDLALQPSQFGLIGSAFFFAFCLSGLLCGFLINRFRARWLLVAFALIWSVAQFAMIFGGNFRLLLVSRVLLGLGEGPAYAAALHAAYGWFPDARRALPSAVITQGSATGAIVAAPLLTLVIVNFGWQSAFSVLGIVGLVWAGLWTQIGADGPYTVRQAESGDKEVRRPYRRLLLNPTYISSCLVVFAAYWSLSLLLVWFPNFLRAGLGFSAARVGGTASLPWITAVVVVLFIGIVSQYLSARGHASRVARVYPMCGLALLGGACLLGINFVADPYEKLVLATLGVALPNAVVAPAQAIFGEISPVSQRGAILSIGNAVAATAGMVAPYATGLMVEKAGSALAGHEAAFLLAGVVVLVANVVGLFLIRPARQAASLAATPV